MLQAITTKYLNASNTRGARIKATAQAGSVTIPWDHAVTVNQNHCAAARALAARLDWSGEYVGGATDGLTYVFVQPFGDDGWDRFTV